MCEEVQGKQQIMKQKQSEAGFGGWRRWSGSKISYQLRGLCAGCAAVGVGVGGAQGGAQGGVGGWRSESPVQHPWPTALPCCRLQFPTRRGYWLLSSAAVIGLARRIGPVHRGLHSFSSGLTLTTDDSIANLLFCIQLESLWSLRLYNESIGTSRKSRIRVESQSRPTSTLVCASATWK